MCVLKGSDSVGGSDYRGRGCWGLTYLSWNSGICVNRKICDGSYRGRCWPRGSGAFLSVVLVIEGSRCVSRVSGTPEEH